MYRIGIDVGGTFTDFTMIDEDAGVVHFHKVPSTPHDPSEAIATGIGQMLADHGVAPSQVPSEMVTASGAGLDPHIPPPAADLQARRIAAARGVPIDKVRELIAAHTEPPTLGFLGRARVNVLELNLDLDAAFGAPAAQVK